MDANRCGTYEKLVPIQAIVGCNGDNCSYYHEVLCPGLEYECLDSTSIMQLVNDYVANTTIHTPISEILIFNSIENFDEGETLSQPKAYFDDMVISIQLPNMYNSDTIFTFHYSGFKGKFWDTDLKIK